jgi:hypothetical protein
MWSVLWQPSATGPMPTTSFASFLFAEAYTRPDQVGIAGQIVHQRLVQLKRIALLRKRHAPCNYDKVVRITEIPFGNSGNNLIEFTHGLWVAKHLNATLLVPHWITHILKPFNTTILKATSCYLLQEEFDQAQVAQQHANLKYVDITSEDSFFLFRIFYLPEYKDMFPELNDTVVNSMSEHFISVSIDQLRVYTYRLRYLLH